MRAVRAIPWFRVAAALTATWLLVAGPYLWRRGTRLNAKWRKFAKAVPPRFSVDLSTGSGHRFTFRQDLTMDHGHLYVYLETKQAGFNVADQLSKAGCTLWLEGPDGRACDSLALNGISGDSDRAEELCLLMTNSLLPAGQYTLHVEVGRAVSELMDVDQQIVLKRAFCPCRYAFPAGIDRLTGGVCIAAGLVAVLLACVPMERWWRPGSTPPGTPGQSTLPVWLKHDRPTQDRHHVKVRDRGATRTTYGAQRRRRFGSGRPLVSHAIDLHEPKRRRRPSDDGLCRRTP